MLRIVLSGVESVGKSRMALFLSRRLGAALVPEFGRTYTERVRRDLTLEDHYAIAEGHALAADQAAAGNRAILVEDTDIVMTTAWATMLFGCRDPILAARPSSGHIHLLLMPDVPFIPDPVRMFGDPEQRHRFHAVVVAEFEARGLTPVRIAGRWSARRAQALAAIAPHLP